MNFQNLNFDDVEAPTRQGPPRFSPSETPEDTTLSTLKPSQRHRLERSATDPSLSPQPTAFFHAPSPPSLTESTAELYGPDRLFGPPAIGGRGQGRPPAHAQSAVRFDEAQLAMFAAENSARMAGIKDDLTLAAGKVTPGVDDTPYIQYALEALSRRRGSTAGQHFQQFRNSRPSDDFEEDYPQPRRLQDEEMAFSPITPPEPAYVEDRLPMERHMTEDRTPRDRPTDRYMEEDLAEESTPETVIHHPDLARNPYAPTPSPPSSDDEGGWIPVGRNMRADVDSRGTKYPPLDYKPPVLRPFSMIILMTLCLLMIVALIFSAIYSNKDTGLTPYPGSIYSGQYFVFRILPQLLAAILLLYSQSIVVASFRILPFTTLASEDPRERKLALFQTLYQKSFLLPRLDGPWQLKLFSVATWLMIFTIPLQSTAFTCVFEDEKWIWAAVQGVVWALVVLYVVQLVATAILMAFWFKRWTGLVWDIRSVGDLLPLLNQSNTMGSYGPMDVCPSVEFVPQLQDRHFDRLGYWQMEDQRRGGAIWYTIGTSTHDSEAIRILGKDAEFSPAPSNIHIAVDEPAVRYRYLPLALRNVTIFTSIILMIALLVTILTVSFVHRTRLDRGFLPLLSARPVHGSFSAANFLYGFLPSLIGMVMFLLFQSLDHSLRVYQPWRELARPSGSMARKSLLADYAACLPFQSTWRAAKNGHWRVAVVSLMGVLFVFIPILAGGLFMALTNTKRTVRMFPNMPVFGVLLAFLFLFLSTLALMAPDRHYLRLPHPASTIAEIISFCAAEETVHDAAFRGVRSRGDLETRLGMHRSDPREETVWYFGHSAGRDERRLSVRPLKRFTEKRARSRRSTRSM